MEYLLAIGAVQSLFLAFLILGKRPMTKDDGVMLVALLLWSLRFASLWLVLQGWNKLLLLPLVLFLADGPLVLLYVHCFTIERQVHYRNYTPHFVPLVLALVYFVIMPLPKGSLAMLFFEELPSAVGLPFQERFLLLALFISLGAYAALGFWRLGVYQRRIRENFSYTEKSISIGCNSCWAFGGIFGRPYAFLFAQFCFPLVATRPYCRPLARGLFGALVCAGLFCPAPALAQAAQRRNLAQPG
ncbi:MAG: hypothetical protein HC913_17570 [Microscillaceae bacterium]|nr:hypothetical protein [Microscillaceae bacterium]